MGFTIYLVGVVVFVLSFVDKVKCIKGKVFESGVGEDMAKALGLAHCFKYIFALTDVENSVGYTVVMFGHERITD